MTKPNTDISRLISSSGIVFAGSFLNKAISFGASIFMARLLGDTDYGVVALGLVVYFIMTNVLSLGQGQGIGRYYPQADSRTEKRSILLTSYSLAVPFSIIMTGLLVLYPEIIATRLFNEAALIPVVRILAIALPLAVSQQLAMGTLRGRREPGKRTVVKDILQPVSRFVAVIALVLAGYGTIGVATSYAISSGIASVVLTAVIIKETEILDRSVSWSWKPIRMLTFSLPLVASTILWRLMTNVDKILIGRLVDTAAAVGHYNIAFVLSQTTLLIYSSLSFIYVPELSHLHASGDFERAEQFYRVSTKWFFLSSLPFILVSLTYPEYIITFLYSTEYSPATASFIILVLGLIVHIGLGQIQNTLTAFGDTQVILFADIVALAANVGLNWILIQEFGILGAATATAVTYTIRNLLLAIVLYREYTFHPFSRAYLTVIAIITTIAAGISQVPIQPSIGAIIVTTLVLCVSTGTVYLRYGVEEADVQLLSRLEERFGFSLDVVREVHSSIKR